MTSGSANMPSADLSGTSATRIARFLITFLSAGTAIITLLLAAVWYLDQSQDLLSADHRCTLLSVMQRQAVLLAICGVLFAWTRSRRQLPRWTAKLAPSIVIVVALVSLDGLVGLCFPLPAPSAIPFELHPTRGWTNRPGGTGLMSKTHLEFDKRGLRIDRTVPPEAWLGKKRLLFVGDSITLGYDVLPHEAFGAQVVRILNERHPAEPWVALNGGACGYDTRQELHWLKKVGLPLKPDAIVLQFCLNDLTNIFDPAGGLNVDRHPEFITTARRSHVSGFCRAFMSLQMRYRFGSDLHAAAVRLEKIANTELLSDPPSERVQLAWKIISAELRIFAETCREKGIPLTIVCFPIQEQVSGELPSTAPQDRLASLAKELGVPYLDLLPTYRRAFAEKDTTLEDLFLDVAHPTARGHRLAAEAIADFLETHQTPPAAAPDPTAAQPRS